MKKLPLLLTIAAGLGTLLLFGALGATLYQNRLNDEKEQVTQSFHESSDLIFRINDEVLKGLFLKNLHTHELATLLRNKGETAEELNSLKKSVETLLVEGKESFLREDITSFSLLAADSTPLYTFGEAFDADNSLSFFGPRNYERALHSLQISTVGGNRNVGRHFLYPIIDDGQRVGYFAFFLSLQQLLKRHSRYDATNYYTILYKESAHEGPTLTGDEEQGLFENISYDTSGVAREAFETIKKSLTLHRRSGERFVTHLSENRDFAFPLLTKELDTVMSFVALQSVDSQPLGYVIGFSSPQEFTELISLFTVSGGLTAIIVLLLTALLIYFQWTRSRFQQLALYDQLTGVANRHLFTELFKALRERQKRSKSLSALVMADVDFFKKVNDTQGHSAGDIVLQQVAKILEINLRKSDLLVRWGGEEFVILLENISLARAREVTESLRKVIELDSTITCSFGVTTFSYWEEDSTIFQRVDSLLYEAKESGRNCVKAAEGPQNKEEML